MRIKKDRISWNKYELRFFLRTFNIIDLCSGLYMDEFGQRVLIDRLSDDGKYRLGACINIPQGLNFAKEQLEDFRTSKLFQGTDLENCRKGIDILRDLMIKTAEKIFFFFFFLRKKRIYLLIRRHTVELLDFHSMVEHNLFKGYRRQGAVLFVLDDVELCDP